MKASLFANFCISFYQVVCAHI